MYKFDYHLCPPLSSTLGKNVNYISQTLFNLFFLRQNKQEEQENKEEIRK